MSSSEAYGLPPASELTPYFNALSTYRSSSHSTPAARPSFAAMVLASWISARTPHSHRSQKSSKSTDRPWCPASMPVIAISEKPLPSTPPVLVPISFSSPIASPMP